jgi:Flp pilus assembly protein TadG
MDVSQARAAVGDERGAVLVWVALMMVALLGFGALAVDIGYAYAVKRQLSVTADASALAGAQAAANEYSRLHPNGGGCTSDVVSEVAALAQTAATQTTADNGPQGSTGAPTTTVSCSGSNINVKVRTSSNLATFFGKVLGVDTMSPAAEATAQVSGSPAYGGLRPFAICIDDFPDDFSSTTVTHQTVFGQAPHVMVTCNGNPPGNWGVVDFDGGSNPTGDIENWTLNGYPGAVKIPSPPLLPGDPGANINPLSNELDSLVGKTILLPVASKWEELGGNNAAFTAVGVLSAKICGWGEKGNVHSTDSSCWDQAKFDTASNQAKLVLQWRYSAFSGSYQTTGGGTAECSLATQACLPVIRLVE